MCERHALRCCPQARELSANFLGTMPYISVQWSRGVSSLGIYHLSRTNCHRMALFREPESDDYEGMESTHQLADLRLVKDLRRFSCLPEVCLSAIVIT